MTPGRAHASTKTWSVVHSDTMISLWELLLPIGNRAYACLILHYMRAAESSLKNEWVEKWLSNSLRSWCRAVARLIVDMWDRKNPTWRYIEDGRKFWIQTLICRQASYLLALSVIIERLIASTEARNVSLILLSHLWAKPLVLIELQAY